MKLDYDEISPVTGNKCVLVEALDAANGIYSKICIESGYYSTTYMHPTNEALEKIEASMPDLIRDSKRTDLLGFNWYLASLNLGVVMLYPSPLNLDPESSNYISDWAKASYDLHKDIKWIPQYPFEWIVCPISLKEDSTEFNFDMEFAHHFKWFDFEAAFDKLNELLNQHLDLDEE